MSEKTKLESGRLLGFDRDGDALWEVAQNDEAARAASRPAGTTKPVGTSKPAGVAKVMKDGDGPS